MIITEVKGKEDAESRYSDNRFAQWILACFEQLGPGVTSVTMNILASLRLSFLNPLIMYLSQVTCM